MSRLRFGAGSLAMAGLRGHARRLGATVLAIVIGVGFVAATLLTLDAVDRGVAEVLAAGVSDSDLVVTAGPEALPAAVVEQLATLDEVAVAGAAATVYGERGGGSFVIATTLPRGPGVALLEGRLPTGSEEAVALGTTMAQVSGLRVGDQVEFLTHLSGTGTAERTTLEVVGLVDLGQDPMTSGQEVMVGTGAGLLALDPGLTYQDVLLDLSPGTSAAAARAAVERVVGTAVVRTGPEEADHRVQLATGDTDVLGAVLLGFGAVALTTSAIVIANTFAIVLAQRTRELALLRCVGATRSQVRRSVLTEALLLGGVASGLGLLAGLGVAWVLARALVAADLGMPVSTGLAPNLTALLVPWVAGVLVTLAAAWWPSRRATRVSPLEAMRPVGASAARSTAGALRIAAGVVLILLGAWALVSGASSRSVPVGVGGGLVSFGGVLLLGVILVPAAIRLLGALTRGLGVPGRLAVDNATSNPGRAAATSAALLVGVTLITMTSVGAASATRTAEEEISAANPIDVIVRTITAPQQDGSSPGAPGALEPDLARRLAGLVATEGSAPLTASSLTITVDGGQLLVEEEIVGVDPTTAGAVMRSEEVLQPLQPGTVGASEEVLRNYGARPGDRVTVIGPSGEVAATVVVFGLGYGWTVHQDVMDAVDPAAPVAGTMLRLDDGIPVDEAMTAVRSTAEGEDVNIDGSAAARESLEGVLGILVLVTTGLLGVAVLIAVIGIANTLSLSVLERARDNALLRALGLTRRQLRGTLATEGVLLAVVSAAIGVALGVLYAWFGVQSLLPADVPVRLAVPWVTLASVLALAVLAGLVASVLPARRAARIAPAAGLALP